ncbi:MliC family protein, partial [Neisseria gonorrhoeae]
MNIRFFALTVPVLSLAACAVPEAYDGGGRGHMPPVQNQAGTDDFRAFSCENGLSVRVRHLDSGKVALRLDGRRAVLSSDVAASGERYTAEHGL